MTTAPRLRFPHPLTLLVGVIALAAALTWVLPAGRFQRRDDPASGRSVVVPGTYARVEAAPVGAFQAVVAVPKGLQDAGSVVFFVFLVGGAFTVVDRTGALRSTVDWLARRLARRETLVIPVVCAFFAAGGALENMQEEIIALVPVLLVLAARLGFDPLTVAAMSVGSAAVGAAFSPVNPFQVGIAQKLAGLPLLGAAGYRAAFFAAAFVVWTWGTARHARRTRVPADARVLAADAPPFTARSGAVLAMVLAAFAAFVYGVLALGWDFDQMSALFFATGIAAGLVGGLGVGGTAEAMVEGFREMAFAALLIGFARSIFVVLDQGRVVDTIVQALSAPLAHLPVALSALGMMAAHTLIHVPVPSVSGQAALTMPIFAPLSDLLGMQRQVAVLAYQYGAGLCEMLTPTNGALMAILAAAGVRYDRWLRFALPLWGALFALGALAVVVAIAVGVR